jgi:hypothetical protein
MRWGSIISRVHELAGLPEAGEFEDLVKMSGNAVYQRLMMLTKTNHETREFSLTTVADTAKYGMPFNVRKIVLIEDTTNKRVLYDVTQQQFIKDDPGKTETGTPDRARPFGTFGVEKQPQTAGVISLVSTETGDDGSNYICVITGFDANGRMIREEVTMDGTTLSSSTASFTTIERIVKAPASGNTFAGTIIAADSDLNVLAHIPTWWESPDFEWIEFGPIPDAALTYTISAEMRKPPLVEDEDWPELPEEFHDLIWRGIANDLFPKIGMLQVARDMRKTLEDRFDEFLAHHGEQPTNRVLVFANVWNMSGRRQRQDQPRVTGVDFL